MSTISIIVPVYNEETAVKPLFARLNAAISSLSRYKWELILVDDGSSDDSVQKILDESSSFPGTVLLRRLSRNFGHQAALMAGLEKSSGDAVIIVDADLQDPPEQFAPFLDHYEMGYDIVYGVRKRRQGNMLMNLAFKSFYLIFRRLSEVPVPLDAGDFGLISKRVATTIKLMPEQDFLMRGLRSWVGFRQVGVAYDRPERTNGQSKYSMRKRIRIATSAFFGFSSLPLKIATLLGLGAVSLGLLYGGYALFEKLYSNSTPQVWTSLIIIVLFLGGAQLISIGILGEYIGRIYKQSLNRPLYIVATDYTGGESTSTKLI